MCAGSLSQALGLSPSRASKLVLSCTHWKIAPPMTTFAVVIEMTSSLVMAFLAAVRVRRRGRKPCQRVSTEALVGCISATRVKESRRNGVSSPDSVSPTTKVDRMVLSKSPAAPRTKSGKTT